MGSLASRTGRLGLGLLVLTALAGCGSQAFVVRPVPDRQDLEESVVQRDGGWCVWDKIAVIDVDGVLMNGSNEGLFGSGENPVSLFQEKLDKARHDRRVKAVVLRLNSPGGTVGAADLMHHSLVSFRAKSKKPVIACVLDLAASGAYYLACGSDGIMAQPTSVTGSIGVLVQTVSFAGAMEKLGVSAEAIKSGQIKDLASPLRRLEPEEREVLKGIVMHLYDNFLAVVLQGRGKLTREKLAPLSDGRVFTSPAALEAGLIDRIGYPADAIRWAKELAKLRRGKAVIYHRPVGYKPNVYASAEPLQPGASLINIGLPSWLRSQGPQFLYLWQIDNLSAP